MWVNLKLQLAWNVCVFRRPIHMLNGKLYRCGVYMLRWELPRNRGLNLIPQAQSQESHSLFCLLAFQLCGKKKKKVQESLTQFQLKGQRTSTGMRACRPAVRSFLEDSCILEKDLDSTSWFSEKCSDHQFIS